MVVVLLVVVAFRWIIVVMSNDESGSWDWSIPDNNNHNNKKCISSKLETGKGRFTIDGEDQI